MLQELVVGGFPLVPQVAVPRGGRQPRGDGDLLLGLRRVLLACVLDGLEHNGALALEGRGNGLLALAVLVNVHAARLVPEALPTFLKKRDLHARESAQGGQGIRRRRKKKKKKKKCTTSQQLTLQRMLSKPFREVGVVRGSLQHGLLDCSLVHPIKEHASKRHFSLGAHQQFGEQMLELPKHLGNE